MMKQEFIRDGGGLIIPNFVSSEGNVGLDSTGDGNTGYVLIEKGNCTVKAANGPATYEVYFTNNETPYFVDAEKSEIESWDGVEKIVVVSGQIRIMR